MWAVILLIIIFLSVLLIAMNQLLIKKFYWGPSGRPPRYKSHEREEKR